MTVPDYETFMLPLLRFVSADSKSIQEAIGHLADLYQLDENDRTVLIPSGRTRLLNNRVHWAATYLVHAGILRRPRRGYIEITARGKSILHNEPSKINRQFLLQYPEFREFLNKSQFSGEAIQTATTIKPIIDVASGTPEERISAAFEELNASLSKNLMSRIVASDPSFFEQLIIDLMLAMGYGGSHAEAARHLGASGDGGIDGVIDGDPLGLDAVYLQAKRYSPGNSVVGRPELQAFVGSLVGKGAQKGVFITTSTFTQTARQYVTSVPHRIVLIDGDQLTRLMISYGVGVRTARTVDLKRVDLDYFGATEDD